MHPFLAQLARRLAGGASVRSVDRSAEADAAGALRAAGRIRRRLHVAGKATPEPVLLAEWKAVDVQREEQALPLRRVLARLAAEQRRRVLDALPAALEDLGVPADASAEKDFGTKRSDPPDELVTVASELLDLAFWEPATAEACLASLVAAMQAGFAAGALRLDVEIDLDPLQSARARQVLRDVVEATAGTTAWTRDRIASALDSGLRAGDDEAAITKRIEAVFEEARGPRAERIARTAVNGVFEAGQVEAFAEAGVERRGWVTQRDGRARAEHVAADGQEVGVGEPFEVGGEELMHPCDPAGSAGNTVNCRCTVRPILSQKRQPPAPSRGRPSIRARNEAMKARWEALCERYDSPVAMQKVLDEFRADGWAISLRTVERACYGR